MTLKDSNLALTLLFVVVVVIFYSKYTDKNSTLYSDDELLKKHIFNGDTKFNNKPFLWVYYNKDSDNKLFRFRENNTGPLEEFCITRIIKSQSSDFNVVLINDSCFSKLIPGWSVDIGVVPEPTKCHVRQLSLITLLYHYGGIICPSTFYPTTSLIDIYRENGCFVFYTNIRTCPLLHTTESSEYLIPNINFIGCKRNNLELKNLMQYLENLSKTDYTNEQDFLKLANRKVDNMTIEKIDGRSVGVKDSDNKIVTLERLIGEKKVQFCDDMIGLYIPKDKISVLRHYKWVLYVPIYELLGSRTNLGDFLDNN
jgi:hypothetical protein